MIRHQPEREQERRGDAQTRDGIADEDDAEGERGERRSGQPAEEGIDHHADAEQMQHAEPDDDRPVGKAESVHPRGDERDEHDRAEHDQAAAEAPRAERRAAAGQDDKEDAAVLLDELEPRGERKVQADEKLQVEQEMDDDDAEDTEAAERVQLPDPLFLHSVLLK